MIVARTNYGSLPLNARQIAGATTITIDRNICALCDTDRSGRSARQLAQTVACGTPPADALRALVGAAPEPSIGGNPPTWHCDHQFYTPLVAYAYRFPAFYEIRRSHVGPPISSRALPRLTRYA